MLSSDYICIDMSLKKYTILYIHGMGGGSDSRIPSILAECFSVMKAEGEPMDVRVVCRTYSFDPEIAHEQISGWVQECRPSLVVGESLGSLHALRVYGLPIILVSPALNTPFYFKLMSWLVLIPGMSRLFGRIYKPREGDRQKLTFTRDVLKKYQYHGKVALDFMKHSDAPLHAFIGLYDHYRRSGVVSVYKWYKTFGKNLTLYDGTHFMEEDYVIHLLAPKILEFLKCIL